MPPERTHVSHIEHSSETEILLDPEAPVIGCLQIDLVLASESIVGWGQAEVRRAAQRADRGIEHLAIDEQRRLHDVSRGLVVRNATGEQSESTANRSLAIAKHV